MPKLIRIMNWITGFIFVLGLCGCRGQNLRFGASESDSSWTSVSADSVPGIDQATVTFVTLNAGPSDGLPFVVWSDLQNGWSGTSQGSASGAFSEGDQHGANGRKLHFRGETADGKTGRIKIAGQSFDFASGTLFLVSARQDPPTIAQVRFDLHAFPEVKPDALQEFARSNAQIGDFFQTAKKANPPGNQAKSSTD
jgi:hypothetical protein